ncbi:MAG: hypothetical protein KIS67_01100 [Verrucomicrobiae bacterium]|nr:hypothetical protein [Verrucomicrobiae bacterium]
MLDPGDANWADLLPDTIARQRARRTALYRHRSKSRNLISTVHPSLLPSSPGLEASKQALDHGVKVTGCTVHFVDAGVDSGPIIGQQTVPVLDDDTPETLHARIHAAEHELYPRCVAALARGSIVVRGRRVVCIAQ